MPVDLSNIQTAQQLAERFLLYGLRVEVNTTREIQYVLHFLDQRMPHWYRTRWHYESARPRSDLPAIGLSDPKTGVHIIEDCVTISHLRKDENTISFSEFFTLSRKRGKYKPRAARKETSCQNKDRVAIKLATV